MKRIIINVPKESEEWKYSVAGKVKRWRANPNTLLKSIFDALAVATDKDKTCVRVNYGHGYHNESIPSQNALKQLWTTACFLENYLSIKTFKRIEKAYLKGGE